VGGQVGEVGLGRRPQRGEVGLQNARITHPPLGGI
jgi:hypothetical protein